MFGGPLTFRERLCHKKNEFAPGPASIGLAKSRKERVRKNVRNCCTYHRLRTDVTDFDYCLVNIESNINGQLGWGSPPATLDVDQAIPPTPFPSKASFRVIGLY